MNIDKDQKLIVYMPNELTGNSGKTGEGTIRYRPESVVCVVDRAHQGKTVGEVISLGGDIPVVGTMEEALKFKAEALLLGCAFVGGRLPEPWIKDIKSALNKGLDVINGLHDFLGDNDELVKLAKKSGSKIVDLRKPPDYKEVASGKAAFVTANTVLTVGTDCSVGKMVTSVEMLNTMRERGHKASLVATGQTGIVVDGKGVVIDRVVGDFIAGVVEKEVIEASIDSDYVFVEGQGSLCHAGYSGVTLALLHGSAPRCMVLCHRAGKTKNGDNAIELPTITSLIHGYEHVAGFVRPSKVVAISLDTRKLQDSEAQEIIESYESLTGLPVTDPIRYGSEKLIDGVIDFCAHYDEQAVES